MGYMGFNERVYELVKKIPSGKVSTYKEIAEALGCQAYRAVGNALNKNTDPDTILCCKIVNSDGRLGGFATGQEEKMIRLNKEGILVKDGRIVDFKNALFRYPKKTTLQNVNKKV